MGDTTFMLISRRDLLKSAALLAGAAALRPAHAQTKAPKAAMKYQESPKGDAQCSNCLQFIPGRAPTAMGTCKVVEGAINPRGWCLAYVEKP